MASTLTAPFPSVLRITLGSSNIATQVNIPNTAKRVSIKFITNAGKVAFEGDDADTVDSNYATFEADVWIQLNWSVFGPQNKGREAVYLASATGSTVVEVLVEA